MELNNLFYDFFDKGAVWTTKKREPKKRLKSANLFDADFKNVNLLNVEYYSIIGCLLFKCKLFKIWKWANNTVYKDFKSIDLGHFFIHV